MIVFERIAFGSLADIAHVADATPVELPPSPNSAAARSQRGALVRNER